MKNNEIFSIVDGGKIYHVDVEGNIYDEIVQVSGLGNLQGIFRKKDGSRTFVGNLFDKVKNGVATVFKRQDTPVVVSPGTPINSGAAVVPSGGNSDSAGQVYQNAFTQSGTGFNLNNKWVLIGGGLLLAGGLFAVFNQKNSSKPASQSAVTRKRPAVKRAVRRRKPKVTK